MRLGLDLSSVNSGYAVMDGDKLIAYGGIIPPKTMTHCEKLDFIYSHINSTLTNYPIDNVSIEDQHLRNNPETLKLLSRISGVAMLCAHQHGIGVNLYHATTVKMVFTGNGKAQKKDMIDRAVLLYNLDRKSIDDNIADAIAVAYTHKALEGTIDIKPKKTKKHNGGP